MDMIISSFMWNGLNLGQRDRTPAFSKLSVVSCKFVCNCGSQAFDPLFSTQENAKQGTWLGVVGSEFCANMVQTARCTGKLVCCLPTSKLSADESASSKMQQTANSFPRI